MWGASGACSWLPPEVGGQAPSRLIAPILAAHRGCGCSQGHHPGNSGTTEHQQMSFRPRERLRARHVLAGELGGGDGEGPRSPPVLPVMPRWPQVVSESLLIFLRWEAFVSHPGRRRVDQEGADCAEPRLRNANTGLERLEQATEDSHGPMQRILLGSKCGSPKQRYLSAAQQVQTEGARQVRPILGALVVAM